MRIYLPHADDDDSPTLTDLREFAQRLQDEREDAGRRRSFDDAWKWFLTLFAERWKDDGGSDERPSRRAA